MNSVNRKILVTAGRAFGVAILLGLIFCFAGCKDPPGDKPSSKPEPQIYDWAGAPKAQSDWGTLSPAGNNNPNNIGNTFSGDPETTRTIYWQSRTSVGEVIIDGIRYPSTATYTSPWYFHRVDVTGLEPGTAYEFICGATVGTTTWYSPVYEFKTLQYTPGEAFSVIQVTDPQIGDGSNAGDSAIWKRVLEKAIETCPDAAFIVNTGDIVDSNKDATIAYYFDYVQNNLGKYPIMYSMGNNDSSKEGQYDWYTKYMRTPADNYDNGFLYSFDYGNVHFLNVTNCSGDANYSLPTTANNWADANLKATAKTWKVAFTHQAPYGRSSNNTNIAKLFDHNNVDLVMAGHNHFYARTKPINAAGADKANGTVYCIPNHAGSKANSASGQTYLAVDKAPGLPMFSVYTFSGTNINLKSYTVSTNGTATLYDEYDWR